MVLFVYTIPLNQTWWRASGRVPGNVCGKCRAIALSALLLILNFREWEEGHNEDVVISDSGAGFGIANFVCLGIIHARERALTEMIDDAGKKQEPVIVLGSTGIFNQAMVSLSMVR